MLKRLTAGVLALAVALLLAGNGFADDKPAKDKPEKETPDQFMKEAIKLMGEFADAFEKIKDKDSAEKAKPKLVDLTKRFKKLDVRGRKILTALPKEDQEALEKKYKPEIAKVSKRLLGAMSKALEDPEARKVLADIEKEASKDDKKGNNTGDRAKTGKLTGKVTYDGKTVPVGIINFHPAKGIGVVAEIENGKYTADKVPAGPVTITVNTILHREIYKNLEKQLKSGGGPPGGGGAAKLKDKLKDKGKLKGLEDLNKRMKKEWEKLKDMIDVPEKFADPEKSGLTYTVQPGDQKFDLDLKKP